MPKQPPQSKEAATGGEKKVLVGVRVPESFHQRIQAQCTLRGMTLQELVITALTIFFKVPTGSGRTVLAFVEPKWKGGKASDKIANQTNAWMETWLGYIQSMPPEKVEIMAKAMQWDLGAQKSSRRKAVRYPALEITMGEEE